MPQKSFTFEGKRYYVRRRTMEEAVADSALLKYKLEQGKRNITKNMLVSDWAEEWKVTYKENSVGESALITINTIINKWINPAIGDMPISQVKPVHCQGIINKAKGYSKSHLKKLKYYIRDIFEKAYDNSLVLENPANKLILPKAIDGKRRAMTEYERRYFLQVCETHKYGAIFLFMLYSGAGPGETRRAMAQHINEKTHQVFIDGTKNESRKRYVPLSDNLKAVIYRAEPKPLQPLFKNKDGRPLTKSNMQRYWEQIWKEMNIAAGCKTDYGSLQRLKPPYPIAKDLTAYCLRHTYATDLRDMGIDITVAMEYMGHSSTDMLAEIYIHPSEKSLHDSLEKMNRQNSGVAISHTKCI